jgi:hypothetical protein
MRLVSAIALTTSAFALAACAGGGGGLNGGGTLSSAGMVAGDIGTCTVQQSAADCIPKPTGGTTTPPAPDSDGDGIPDATDPVNGTGSGAGGNTTGNDTGDTTIALELSKLVVPKKPDDIAKSLFTSTLTPTGQLTTDKILSGTKPPDLRMAIDTKASSNGTWAVPVTMKQYAPGTTRRDIFNGGTANENIGAGSNYREYRALTGDRDELLQVWAWGDSYGVQYRNASSGGEAKQQAWSFGGNATKNMPFGGKANYNGRFAGTAKTWNWLPKKDAKISANGLWQIQGKTALVADFGSAGSVSGTLTPETWTKLDANTNTYYTFDTTTGTGYVTRTGDPVNLIEGPVYQIYNTTVGIDAKIDAPVGGVASSTYKGNATFNGDFVTGDNPVYGGFFGTAAKETTGVFAAYGNSPDPDGGMDGINDDRRGFISMSGTFHGCTPACPPPPLLP